MAAAQSAAPMTPDGNPQQGSSQQDVWLELFGTVRNLSETVELATQAFANEPGDKVRLLRPLHGHQHVNTCSWLTPCAFMFHAGSVSNDSQAAAGQGAAWIASRARWHTGTSCRANRLTATHGLIADSLLSLLPCCTAANRAPKSAASGLTTVAAQHAVRFQKVRHPTHNLPAHTWTVFPYVRAASGA